MSQAKRVRSFSRILVAGLALVFAFAVVPDSADAQKKKKAKSTQSEAEWLTYDEAGQTVTVKIKKPGKGPNKKMVKKNREQVFNVKAEGSILVRTSVAINGKKAGLEEIPEGKTVLIYWVPDEKNDGQLFARKVDVIFSEEELNERYNITDAE